MMVIRRITVVATLTALLVTAGGGFALAKKGADDASSSSLKVSEKFADMSEYNWGLGDVVRLMVKGVFKGRSETEFAPGAAITRQEMAVAAIRLMDKESEAKLMLETEVNTYLNGLSDKDAIATWARASVAALIKAGAIDAGDAFRPTDEATRLDVAVLLVKALGYTAEAAAKADAELGFKDAGQIPAELRGYVAAAVDHGIIKGYDNGTFRPERAVKRVEMAVMMGRADRQIERGREGEIRGIAEVVSADSITLRNAGGSLTFPLAAGAAIFVDHQEAALDQVQFGMAVELKLNADLEVVFLEAESKEPLLADVRGSFTGLIPASGESLAVVKIDGNAYAISQKATIIMRGQRLTLDDLQEGDELHATLVAGVVQRMTVVREQSPSGGSSSKSEFKGTVEAKGEGTLQIGETTYSLAENVAIYLKGDLVTLDAVQVGATVEIKVEGGVITRIKLESASDN